MLPVLFQLEPTKHAAGLVTSTLLSFRPSFHLTSTESYCLTKLPTISLFFTLLFVTSAQYLPVFIVLLCLFLLILICNSRTLFNNTSGIISEKRHSQESLQNDIETVSPSWNMSPRRCFKFGKSHFVPPFLSHWKTRHFLLSACSFWSSL